MSSMRAGCRLCVGCFLILDRCFKFSNLTNTQAETEEKLGVTAWLDKNFRC